MGTLGCFRQCRSLVATIRRAIEEANAHNDPDNSRHLREETHEHYRLHADGVFSRDACTEGTRRILSLYD